MERNRTIGDLLNPISQRREGGVIESSDVRTMDFTTFVTLFGVNLVHRFPIDQIETIDSDTVENLAGLAYFCTPILVEQWNRFQTERQQGRRPTRVA